MRRLLVAASFFSLSAVPAFAADSVKIEVTKADFASEASIGALYARVGLAAKSLCRQELLSEPTGLASLSSCTRASIDQAVTSAHFEALTAYHKAMTDKTAAPISATLASR